MRSELTLRDFNIRMDTIPRARLYLYYESAADCDEKCNFFHVIDYPVKRDRTLTYVYVRLTLKEEARI